MQILGRLFAGGFCMAFWQAMSFTVKLWQERDSCLWTNKDLLLGQVEMMGILSENGRLKMEFVMNQGVSPEISPGL